MDTRTFLGLYCCTTAAPGSNVSAGQIGLPASGRTNFSSCPQKLVKTKIQG